MKFHLTLFSVLAAITLLNFPQLLDAETQKKEAEVAFTFGKVEILKRHANEWEFLRRGDNVRLEDIIRMPPASILRLKAEAEVNLPMIVGSREQDVFGLIADAKDNLSSQTHRKIVPESSGTADIDALPVGTYSSYKSQTSEEIEPKLDPRQLKSLRLLIQNKVESLRESAINQIRDIPGGLNRYPTSNLLKAKRLFQILGGYDKTEKPIFELQSGLGRDIDRTLLMCAFLKAASIESDVQVDAEGRLFVVFDSGVPNRQFKKLTANRNLIFLHLDQNVWIPLYLSLKKGDPNFTQAWYNGSEMALK